MNEDVVLRDLEWETLWIAKDARLDKSFLNGRFI